VQTNVNTITSSVTAPSGAAEATAPSVTVSSDRGGQSNTSASSDNTASVGNGNGLAVTNGVVSGSSTGLNHAGSLFGDVGHTSILAGTTSTNSTVATSGNTVMSLWFVSLGYLEKS